MILTAHQPNFIPWISFFEKMEASDIFVILGTCQFEKNGYQNRFWYRERWNTMAVRRFGFQKIMEKKYAHPAKDYVSIMERYPSKRRILGGWMEYVDENLFETNIKIIFDIKNKLHIKTKVVVDTWTTSTKSQRLVDLCKAYGANEYMSGPSGKKYMDTDLFEENKINVTYHETKTQHHVLDVI